ncbi:hypothetical protein T484DRAFT_1911867, partial [Baffinella frigidus]
MRSTFVARLLATAVLLPHILRTSPAAGGLALSQLSASSAARVGGGALRCSVGQLVLRGGGRRRKAPADPDVEIPHKKARGKARQNATAEVWEAASPTAGLAPSSPAAVGSPNGGLTKRLVAPSPCIKCGDPDHCYAACPQVAAEKREKSNGGKGVAKSLVAGECWSPDTLAEDAYAEALGTALWAGKAAANPSLPDQATGESLDVGLRRKLCSSGKIEQPARRESVSFARSPPHEDANADALGCARESATGDASRSARRNARAVSPEEAPSRGEEPVDEALGGADFAGQHAGCAAAPAGGGSAAAPAGQHLGEVPGAMEEEGGGRAMGEGAVLREEVARGYGREEDEAQDEWVSSDEEAVREDSDSSGLVRSRGISEARDSEGRGERDVPAQDAEGAGEEEDGQGRQPLGSRLSPPPSPCIKCGAPGHSRDACPEVGGEARAEVEEVGGEARAEVEAVGAMGKAATAAEAKEAKAAREAKRWGGRTPTEQELFADAVTRGHVTMIGKMAVASPEAVHWRHANETTALHIAAKA